jgi:hypothetical protein
MSTCNGQTTKVQSSRADGVRPAVRRAMLKEIRAGRAVAGAGAGAAGGDEDERGPE